MAFLHVNKPAGTGFFVFPIDPESIQSKTAHDFARVLPLPSVERLLSPQTIAILRPRLGASGRLAIVGLVPEESVTKKWELIDGGETVFFVSKAGLLGVGTTVHAEKSRTLAEQVFGRGTGIHELLVFLVDVTPTSLPLAKFNEAIGRRASSPFKGFTTLSREQIHKIDERYGSFYGFLEAVKVQPAPEGGPAGA